MKALFVQHLAAMQLALKRLFKSPLSSFLSLLVIALALALPCAGWLVLDNLRDIAGNTAHTQQISLFMEVKTSEKELQEIESRLKQSDSGSWRFIARDDALKNLQSKEGMADIMAGLSKNPLPDAFIVTPSDSSPAKLEELATSFSAWPKVAHVQLDSAWIKRFDAILRIGKLSITLLAALFATTLVVVTFNTIRLQILGEADEIEVAKLIGATNAFICRPFQYYGAIQGALGGLFAALLVTLGGYLLSDPAGELIALYGSGFVPHGLSLRTVLELIATGGILGWIGAQLSVVIHLLRSN